jgi:hypothetical protein
VCAAGAEAGVNSDVNEHVLRVLAKSALVGPDALVVALRECPRMLEVLCRSLLPPGSTQRPGDKERHLAVEVLHVGLQNSTALASLAADMGCGTNLLAAVLASSSDGTNGVSAEALEPADVALATEVLLKVVEGASRGAVTYLLTGDLVHHVVSVIDSTRTAYLAAQPGGAAAVRRLFPLVAKILHSPFVSHPTDGFSQPSTPTANGGELRLYQVRHRSI